MRHLRRPSQRLPLVMLGLARGATGHSNEEQACLARYARDAHVAVELGVYEGRGTRVIRTGMSREGILYAVDPFSPGRMGVSLVRLIAWRESVQIGGPTLTWLRMTASEAAPLLASVSFDLIYYDFDSTSVAELAATWQDWRTLLAPNGICIATGTQIVEGRTHDDFPNVRFRREVLDNDPLLEFVEGVGTFSVYRKRM